jgi:hypothetical protein
MMPLRILCFVVMIIVWVVVYQNEQNDHRRDERACALYFCYANPSFSLGLRLLWALSLLPFSRNFEILVRINHPASTFTGR